MFRLTRSRENACPLRYTRYLWPRKPYQYRDYLYSYYRQDRYEFYKCGLATLRLPGKFWSPVFMAAYQIALTCQKPTLPAQRDRSLATRISIYANLLLLTPDFRRLNSQTRERYRFLVEDFCSRLAGCPISLDTHRKTALFVRRRRSHAHVERKIIELRKMIIEAGHLVPHPSVKPKPVNLKAWTRRRRAAALAAKIARIQAREVRYFLKNARRDAKVHAYERMVARGRLIAAQPVSQERLEARAFINRHWDEIMSDPLGNNIIRNCRPWPG